MVSVSTSLVDERQDEHRVLQSYPLSRVLLKLVKAAHAQLLRVQRLGPTPERLVEISERLGELNGRHDDVLRGLYYGLLAQEYLAANPEVAARVRKLRFKMFPEELMATRKSYRGQMGQAEMLESRLTEEDLALLARLSTAQGGTFATSVEEWFELAAEMRKLDDERMGDIDAPTAAEVLAARNNWIRAIQAFIAPLRVESDAPKEVLAILDRIETTVAKASQRHGRGNGKDADEPGTGDDNDIVVSAVAGDAAAVAADDAPAADAAVGKPTPSTEPVATAAGVLGNQPPVTTPEEQPAG